MRIFLSYRHADVGGHAGRLSDTLVQRLGTKNVFHDVSAIAAGRDFVSAIREALDGCDAAMAVIGPGWLTATTPEGRPRLFEPDDYVRLELASVLQRDLPVAPVLVGGATLPAPGDLPEDLRPLVQRQAFGLHDQTWHQDVDNLVRSLRGEPAVAGRASRRPIALAAGGPDGLPYPDRSGMNTLAIGANSTGREPVREAAYVYRHRAVNWRQLEPGRWQVVIDVSLENTTGETASHADHRYNTLIVGQREFKQSCFDASQEHVSPGTIGDARTGYLVSCEPGGRVDLVLNDRADTRFRVTDATEPSPC